MARILIVTGEASGDLYGGMLTRALRTARPDVEVLGTGSTRMREAGAEILEDPTSYAAIGFVDAARRFTRYSALYRKLVSALTSRRPDVLVLVDFPDFNLRLAPRAVERGIPVVYFIPPQLWAWRPGRIKTIAQLCRKILVIFPFEQPLYRDAGVDVTFVGHPLLDILASVAPPAEPRGPGAAVGLLPGSRRTQFAALLPRMAAAARLVKAKRPDAAFVVAGAPTLDREWAEALRRETAPEFPLVWDRTREIVAGSAAILTASGTATVEAAILGTPMVVTYWVNPLAAIAAAPFLKVRDYAMVNLLAGRRIVPELYQFKAQPALLADALLDLLEPSRNAAVRRDLADVKAKLGTPGGAARAATAVLNLLS